MGSTPTYDSATREMVRRPLHACRCWIDDVGSGDRYTTAVASTSMRYAGSASAFTPIAVDAGCGPLNNSGASAVRLPTRAPGRKRRSPVELLRLSRPRKAALVLPGPRIDLSFLIHAGSRILRCGLATFQPASFSIRRGPDCSRWARSPYIQPMMVEPARNPRTPPPNAPMVAPISTRWPRPRKSRRSGAASIIEIWLSRV